MNKLATRLLLLPFQTFFFGTGAMLSALRTMQQTAGQNLGRTVNRGLPAPGGAQPAAGPPARSTEPITGAALGATTTVKGDRTMDQDLSGDQVKVVQYTIVSVVPNINDETRVLVGPKTVAFTNNMTASDFTSWIIALNCKELDQVCVNRKYVRVAFSVQGRFAPVKPDYAQEQVLALGEINRTLRKGFNIPPGQGDAACEPS